MIPSIHIERLAHSFMYQIQLKQASVDTSTHVHPDKGLETAQQLRVLALLPEA